MEDFELMQDTADSICKSMIENPNEWTIDSYEVHNSRKGVSLWLQDLRTCWNGSSRDVVFSSKQAQQIGTALRELQRVRATAAQEKFLQSFPAKKIVVEKQEPLALEANVTAQEKSVWWKFWK